MLSQTRLSDSETPREPEAERVYTGGMIRPVSDIITQNCTRKQRAESRYFRPAARVERALLRVVLSGPASWLRRGRDGRVAAGKQCLDYEAARSRLHIVGHRRLLVCASGGGCGRRRLLHFLHNKAHKVVVELGRDLSFKDRMRGACQEWGGCDVCACLCEFL